MTRLSSTLICPPTSTPRVSLVNVNFHVHLEMTDSILRQAFNPSDARPKVGRGRIVGFVSGLLLCICWGGGGG